MAFLKSEYLYSEQETTPINTILENISNELNTIQNVISNKIFNNFKNYYFASVVDLRDKKTYSVFSDASRDKKGLSVSSIETTPSGGGGGGSVDLAPLVKRVEKLETSTSANAYFVRSVQ